MNAKRTKVIVSTYPNFSCNVFLYAWLDQHFDMHHVHFTNTKDLIVARNLAIRDEVKPVLDQFDDFVFVDSDIQPRGAADPFLEADGDCVGCRYPTGQESAWSNPSVFHHGLVKIKHYVFRELTPPWYQFVYSSDGCAKVKCECNFLADKIQAAGFEIKQAGYAEHPQRKSTWC